MADENMRTTTRARHGRQGRRDEGQGQGGRWQDHRRQSTEAGGKMDQMKGKAKEMAGDMKDKTDD